METLSPIVLVSDQFTLEGDGAFFDVNPQQIANPNREAMLIDEFRLCFAAGAGTIHDLASVRVRLSVGNSPLTNSLIPMVSFAPIYANQGTAINTLVWHPAKPLYVPPDVQLNAMFQRRNPFPGTWSSTPGTIFNFAVAARSVPAGTPIPSKICVPYACATNCYANTFSSTTGETTPFTSKDNEIGNPFDAALRMSYLAGMNITSEDNASRVGVLVQGTYASGKAFIRDQTPFLALFPQNRPMLRLNGLMKPKDFIKFTLSLNPIVAATDAQNDIKFTTIGLTGYRMIDTPRGGWLP